MKSIVQRSLLVLGGVVLIVASMPFVLVDKAYAYNDFDSCVQGESTAFAPNGNLSDTDFNSIEAACRREFPTTTTASARPTSSSRARSSTTPRATATATSTPAASSSASSTPTTTSSPATTTTPSSTASSSSNSASGNNSTSSSSSAQSQSSDGSRSGPSQPSMFSDHTDPNLIFRTPPAGANTDGSFVDQYAQPLLRIGDRQLGFQIIVNFFLSIISVVALLFLVFNGYRYAMARGEDSQISQAKKGITYALIGLIVVLAAYTIVATVLNFGSQSSSSPGIGVNIGVSL